jgi:MFS family permease
MIPTRGLRAMGAGLPRAFWFLWTGMLISRLGTFVLPFLALYLTQGRGLSLSAAGVVAAIYGAGGAVAGPMGGFLADRVGRRLTMRVALGLGGAGMIALGFVHRIEILAPGLFAVALVSEMYRPAAQAAISDLVAPADRVRAFGLLYWVINVGFAIGLTIGGLLASKSFMLLFVCDGATTLLFGLLIGVGVPETRPARQRRPPGDAAVHPLADFLAPFRDPLFATLIVLNFMLSLVFMQNATTFAVDMTSHGISRAVFGRVLALNGLLIVLVQPFLGPLLARRNRSRTLAAGTALVAAGFGWNALATTVPMYVFGVILWTAGEMAVLPVASALVADLSPPESRGRYQGAYGLSFGLAVCAAPALGMFALEHYGPVVLWVACLALGLAAAAGQWLLEPAVTRARRQRLAASPPGETAVAG